MLTLLCSSLGASYWEICGFKEPTLCMTVSWFHKTLFSVVVMIIVFSLCSDKVQMN